MTYQPSFEHATIVIALRKMLNTSSHFNVCALDSALEVAGIKITKEQRAPFHALHCVDYAEMPPGFKEQLANRILVLFSLPPDFKLDIEPKQIAEPRRGWLRLLGGVREA